MSELLKKVQSVCKVGNFTLTSGRQSTFYVDVKSLLLRGACLSMIAKDLSNLVDTYLNKNIDPDIFYVGGTPHDGSLYYLRTEKVISHYVMVDKPDT